MALLKTLTINGVTYKVAQPVPVVNISLPASRWAGSGNSYSQVASVPGVTEKSQVNLTPSVDQLSTFYEKDITFTTENDGGQVTVRVIGQKPANDYTIPASLVEVERTSGKVYGTTVTTPLNPEKFNPTGVVKTINGVAPDANGNITVSGFTEADKEAIVNEVIAALPAAEGGSF